MPGTEYVSAINAHICRSVAPGCAGDYVTGRSAAYENQAYYRRILVSRGTIFGSDASYLSEFYIN